MEKYLISEAFENLGSKRKLFEAASLKVKDKIALASNPNTPRDVLDKLSKDRSYDVLRAVANNPNTSMNALRRLLDYGEYGMWRDIIRRPEQTEIIEMIVNDYDGKWWLDLVNLIAHELDLPKDVLVSSFSSDQEMTQLNDFQYTDDEFDGWE